MWHQIWTTVIAEFSDLSDVESVTKVVVRLLVAGLLGGLLGFERERRGKSAGIRTHMLVAVGAATFVLVTQQNGATADSISRVFQGVVQGVGFLGAGAIIISSEKCTGLTTAASIWATAGIGMTAGLGLESTAVLATLIILLILAAVPKVLRKLSPVKT